MSENRSCDHAVILPTGTQGVVLKEVRGTNGAVLHPDIVPPLDFWIRKAF